MTNAEINSFLQTIRGMTLAQLKSYIDNSSTTPESGIVRDYNEAIYGRDVKDDILKFVLIMREYCDRSFEDDEALAHIAQNYASLNYEDAEAVPDGSDYDELTTPGNYVVTTSAHAQTMENCPIAYPHRLFVMTETGATARFVQIIISNSNNNIYYRTKLTAGWHEWVTIDIPYLKKNYAALNYEDAAIVPDETNYNSLTTPGNYAVLTAAHAQTMIHCPVRYPHRLFVMTETGNSSKFVQLIICNTNNNIYYRTHTSDGWYEWVSIDIPYLKKNYAALNYEDAAVVADETDYDTLTTPGNYAVLTAAHAETMENCPIAYPHRLFVMTETGATARFVQIIISNSNNSIYYRTKLTAGWHEWVKIGDDTMVKNVRDYDGFLYRLESAEPVPVGSSALGYNQFITQTWDTLRADYPDEVTKSVISTDSSGTYNIYKYVFAPRDYRKTVLLTAGCHGDEYEGFWSLYRLMRRIYDDGYKFPNLRNLRHNVRFIIIPSWNPWGVQNRQRLQSQGVSPNDNLNKSVTVDDVTYEPFETSEANAIKTVMDEYEGKISAWVDIHTDPLSKNSHLKRGCYGYVTANTPFAKILYGLDKDFKNIIRDDFDFSVNPPLHEVSSSSTTGIAGYGNSRGIPSALIEMTPDEFSEGGSAETMKLAEEWYGNVIANFICAI